MISKFLPLHSSPVTQPDRLVIAHQFFISHFLAIWSTEGRCLIISTVDFNAKGHGFKSRSLPCSYTPLVLVSLYNLASVRSTESLDPTIWEHFIACLAPGLIGAKSAGSNLPPSSRPPFLAQRGHDMCDTFAFKWWRLNVMWVQLPQLSFSGHELRNLFHCSDHLLLQNSRTYITLGKSHCSQTLRLKGIPHFEVPDKITYSTQNLKNFLRCKRSLRNVHQQNKLASTS